MSVEICVRSLDNLWGWSMHTLYSVIAGEERDFMCIGSSDSPTHKDRWRYVLAQHHYAHSTTVDKVDTNVETAVLLATIGKIQELDILRITLVVTHNNGELRICCTLRNGKDRFFIVPYAERKLDPLPTTLPDFGAPDISNIGENDA